MLNFCPDSHPVISFKIKSNLRNNCFHEITYSFIVIARPEEGGVMMEDLETLQMELETLLNAVVIRSVNLQREIAGMTEKVW